MLSRRSMLAVVGAPLVAQESANGLLTMLKFPGGPMKTDLGHGVVVNKNSSLDRIWYTINDGGCPIQLTDCGITSVYVQERFTGRYMLVPRGAVKAAKNIRAFDLTFALFNAWGDRTRLLGYTQVMDLAAGAQHTMESGWNTTEEEVSLLRSSVGFVSRVLTEDETVWNCDYNGVSRKLAEAKIKISAGRLAQPVKE